MFRKKWLISLLAGVGLFAIVGIGIGANNFDNVWMEKVFKNRLYFDGTRGYERPLKDISAITLGANSVITAITSTTLTTTGDLGVGTDTPQVRLHVEEDDSGTSTAFELLRLTRTSSGTPTTNIGLSMVYEVETSNDNLEKLAIIDILAIDETAATEDAVLVLKLMGGGSAASERVRFGTNTTSFLDNTITNVGDISLDSLTADGTNITVNSPFIFTDSTSFGTETVITTSDDPVGFGTASANVSFTAIITDATGAGTDTVDLADGTIDGQYHIFALQVDGESNGCAVVPASFRNGTSTHFHDVGDGMTLVWDGVQWTMVSNVGGTVVQ